MNFLSKAKTITNLSGMRAKQLDQYEEIYQEIEKYSEECPQEIIHFMVNQHSLNRLRSKKLYDDSLLNFFSNVDENLSVIDNNINQINKALKSKHFCKNLKNFIYYQTTIINDMKDII